MISSKTFLKNILGYSTATYVGAILSLVSIPLSTRFFSTTEMGKINMYIAYANILMVFCNMGYEQAFVRFCNDSEEGNKIETFAGQCMFISMCALVVVSVFSLLFYKKISMSVSGQFSLWCVISLILLLISKVIIQYTTLISRMSQNIFLYSLQAISTAVVTRCIYIFAAVWDATYETATTILVASNILLCIAALIYFIPRGLFFGVYNITYVLLIRLTKYAVPLVPTFFLSMANMYLPQFVLRSHVGFDAIGIYTNAVTMASVLALVQSGFNAYWPAFVFANYKTEQKTIQTVHKYVVLVITLFAMTAVVGQDILYILVGADFRASKRIFPILIIVPVVYTIAETTRIGIRLAQKTYYELLVSVCVLALNYVLCLALIHKYALVGAALSSALSSIFGLYIASYIANKYYRAVNSFVQMSVAIIVLLLLSYINLSLTGGLKYLLYACMYCIVIIVYKNQIVDTVNFCVKILKRKV